MNLIELENLVKGAPDEYLVKEVQQPTGKVPPFLALSEIQRRKDMRDRYLAQKNEGPKPTIAEQLTGGIGSIGGAQPPQGAPIPTPSATGIPSVGAPPVASGAAPMPTPQGQPQGFAAGGIVKLATAGQVPVAEMIKQAQSSGGRRSTPTDYMEGYWERNFPTLMASKEFLTSPLYEYPEVYLRGAMQGDPDRPQTASGAFEPITSKLKAQDAARLAEASVLPASPAPDYLRGAGAPIRASVLPESSVSAPMSANPDPLPAPAGGASRSGGAGSYTVAPGGIAAFDPAEAIAGSIPSGGTAPAARMPNPYNLSPEELSYQEFMKNDENFKLPEALSYQGFIDEAVGEEQAIREEAKRQAIGAALVQLGAGLAAGDMAKGLTTAGVESRDILSEGRREASAQKALAQQFKLRGMEGEREQRMKMMEIEQQRAMSLAQFAGGNRRDAEARAMQIMEMKQRAADRAANLSASLANQEMTRDRYALEAKKDRVQLRSELLRATIGEPPSAKAMAEYQEQVTYRLDPKTGKPKPGVAIPPNPMTVYRELAAQVAPEVERQVAEAFGETGYTPVAPISNPPNGTTTQVGRFKVQTN